MFFWKWTLWMVTWVLCQVFAPLSSCFSGKGKLGLLWPVRSPTLLVICGNMPVLARTTPSLWICCASGSRCFGFHLPCYSAKCFLRSFLPSGSSGSLPANHSFIILSFCSFLFWKYYHFAHSFWITDYHVKLCRFKSLKQSDVHSPSLTVDLHICDRAGR